MVEIIICLGIGFLLGGLILFLILRPRLKKIKEINHETEEYNFRLEQENSNLQNQKQSLNNDIYNLETKIIFLKSEKDSVLESIEDLKKQANKSAEIFEEQAIEKANLNIENAITKLGEHYQQVENEYRQSYEDMLQECVQEARETLKLREAQVEEIQKQIDTTQQELDDLRKKSNSAVAAAKRAEEMRTAADFYRIQLTELDIKEIEMLRNVAPYLRDKEPLNKVIWKCYYENPTNDLIGRVVGSGTHMGIYKITNLENNMCYVGQAVNIADRWKQHIKRGVGADTPTRNKLYPAMIALGPENFSFEIIEECSREQLNDREDYWQDYFKAKEFGYSIK